MVGKIILWILLGLLGLLAVLLLIPVKLRASYREGKPFLMVRYGPVKLQIFPPKEKPEEKEPSKKEKPKEKKPKKPQKAPTYSGPGAEAGGKKLPYPPLAALYPGGGK